VSLTVGSLFSGIGGLDLGLERAGMTVRWQSEIHRYACRVLAKHWPDVPNLGDITTIDWSQVEPVDLICGGYPCQPFSLAGVRRGGGDARHLWPYFLDAIRHIRPRYALLENVAGHLSLGFGRVLGDLAESGYDATWDCIPAAAVGAPHRRDRVFVIAHPRASDVADTEGERCGASRQIGASHPRANVVAGHAGQPPRVNPWATEPDVGRVADGVPSRMDRLYGLGNAVVPQVAEHVGRQILAAHLMERAA
jgi:DNA (cytosine-5)-methyltransferase 1